MRFQLSDFAPLLADSRGDVSQSSVKTKSKSKSKSKVCLFSFRLPSLFVLTWSSLCCATPTRDCCAWSAPATTFSFNSASKPQQVLLSRWNSCMITVCRVTVFSLDEIADLPLSRNLLEISLLLLARYLMLIMLVSLACSCSSNQASEARSQRIRQG